MMSISCPPGGQVMLREETNPNHSKETLSSGMNLSVYEEDLRRRVTTFPRDAQGWFYLGSHLRRQKKYHESEAALRRALEINPNPPHIVIELALLLEEMGRTKEADEILSLLGRNRERFAIIKEIERSRQEGGKIEPAMITSPCIECRDYTYYGCSRNEPCAKFIVWRSTRRGF
jgi:tetratricopeptide (TPR) repeat protein